MKLAKYFALLSLGWLGACGEPMSDLAAPGNATDTTTAQGELEGEYVNVFTDDVSNGWSIGGWNTTAETRTSFYRSGSRSLRVQFNDAWGGFSFDYGWSGPGVGAKTYEYAEFYINPGSIAEDAEKNLLVSTDSPGATWYPLKKYLAGELRPNTWTRARIPIAEINGGTQSYHRLTLRNDGYAPGFAFYLDDVRVQKPGSSTPNPPPPQPPPPQPPPPSGGARSAGCNAARVSPNMPNGRSGSVNVGGRNRTYWLYVPSNYDHQRAMPVIYTFHGAGAEGGPTSTWLSVQKNVENNAVVVFPDADSANGRNWDRSGSNDLNFFDALRNEIDNTLCIDTTKRFAIGFSQGAYFVNYLGCNRQSSLRAIAAGAGGFSSASCNAPNNVLVTHNANDPTVPISRGEDARDRWISVNGCNPNIKEPAGLPQACDRYPSCSSGKPVVWCEDTYDYRWDGGAGEWNHSIRPPQYLQVIWSYFKQVDG